MVLWPLFHPSSLWTRTLCGSFFFLKHFPMGYLFLPFDNPLDEIKLFLPSLFPNALTARRGERRYGRILPWFHSPASRFPFRLLYDFPQTPPFRTSTPLTILWRMSSDFRILIRLISFQVTLALRIPWLYSLSTLRN